MLKRVISLLLGLGLIALTVVSRHSSSVGSEVGIFLGAACVFYALVGKKVWIGLFRPLSKIGFVLIGTLLTIFCIILYIWTPDDQFDLRFFFVTFFLVVLKGGTKPIKPIFPIWKNREYLYAISYLLLAALILILMSHFPEAMLKELLGTWYFIGILWLFLIAFLTTTLLEAKEIVKASERESLEKEPE